MAGTGIGTFSDRLRDAVRGGGPFDEDPRIQGFASGLYTDPNGAAVNGTPAEQLARLQHSEDLVKLGLAGNLRDYTFTDSSGQMVTGSEVDYNGQPAGYAADPSETITYVDAHDNETLFDVLQYKLPPATSMADRVRMNTIALATTALGQSAVVLARGQRPAALEVARPQLYNSGDWFNRVDWSATRRRRGARGCRRGPTTRRSGTSSVRCSSDPALRADAAAIRTAHARAEDLLAIRFSSPLFRLGTAARIQRDVSFPARTGDAGRDRDEARQTASWSCSTPRRRTTTQAVAGTAGREFALHPVQAGGDDPVVKKSRYETGASRCRREPWRSLRAELVAERELRVLGHLVRGPRRGEDHARHDLLDAVDLAHELLHLLGDLGADRAGRRGERERDVDLAAVDVDVVDQAELDEVQPELGIDDVGESFSDVFLGEHTLRIVRV